MVWYRSIRMRNGKLTKMKSGAVAEKTERDAWIRKHAQCCKLCAGAWAAGVERVP